MAENNDCSCSAKMQKEALLGGLVRAPAVRLLQSLDDMPAIGALI